MDKIEIHKGICDSLHQLYRDKNHDYGDSAAQTRKIIPHATLIRLHDKLNRLTTLLTAGDPAKVKDESVDDTLMDLAGYALIELTERRVDREMKPRAGTCKASDVYRDSHGTLTQHCGKYFNEGFCMAQKGMPECSGLYNGYCPYKEPAIEDRAAKIGQYLMDTLSIGENDLVQFEEVGGVMTVRKGERK